MPAQNNGELILRKISPDDVVSGLSLGDPAFVPLKVFLGKHAKRYHQQNTAKTYVFVEEINPNKIVAYITLVCSQIQVDAIPDGVGEYAYADFPAVKIARLAVDRRFQRAKGLGTQLIDLAMAITTQNIMPHVGCRFLIVDSKKDSIKFYEKYGFRLLDTTHNKAQAAPLMFIDVGKLG